MAAIHIGLCGWRGDFYPEGLTRKRELQCASRAVNSLEINTANFHYLRLHGDNKLYASGYSAQALKCWGDRIECWAPGTLPEPEVLP